MSSSGPKYPTTITSVDWNNSNTLAWSPTSAIGAADGTTASCNNPYDGPAPDDSYLVSQQIRAKAFGFTIPTTATINGIVVEIGHSSDWDSTITDYSLQLIKTTSPGGEDKASSTPWSSSAVTYGTSTSLWGQTWTPTQINSSNFGVGFDVLFPDNLGDCSDYGYAYVDYIRVTVYYTPAAGGVSTSGSMFLGM